MRVADFDALSPPRPRTMTAPSEQSMVLLLDNYDSFVFNLARYLEELGTETSVVRNDATTVEEIEQQPPRAIILSPGPRTPDEAGITLDVVRRLGGRIPILGVCLGHQAIGQALGGEVIRSPEPRHGRTSLVSHEGTDVFAGLPSPFRATRYHSLIVSDRNLPPELAITARTESGLIMGLAHREWPLYGVQFHPEAILTEHGHVLLANFLRLAGIGTVPRTSAEWSPRAAGDDFFEQPIGDASPPLPSA